MKRISCQLIVAALIAWLPITPAWSASGEGDATFPSQPVRLLLPQTPGGSTDILARILSPKLTEKWGQSVVVDNRGGANGIIGTETVAKSAPDGYTLIFTYVATYAINAGLYKKLPYDPVKDFAAVAMVANVPFIMVVSNNVPVKTLQELVALAKSKPGQLSFGASTGALGHLIGAMVNQAANIDTVHVPYRGLADAANDLMGGRLPITYSSIGSLIGFVKAGKMKALAIASTTRSPALPDLPTMAEAGYPNIQAQAWFGIMARAGTPAQRIQMINSDVNRILAMKDVGERFASIGAEPFAMTPEEFTKIAHDDITKWAKVIKAAGVTVD